jgi:hypothetical protein
MVVRRESIDAGFEKMAQCCKSLTTFEYWTYALKLSLEGNSDEAAAVLVSRTTCKPSVFGLRQ